MRKLHVVGFTTDFDGLIFSTRKGAKTGSFVVDIGDELMGRLAEASRLRNGVDEPSGGDESAADRASREAESRPPRPQSELTPREIQSRLRAGRSIDDVAREARVERGWVERFAAPILAEQAQVTELARAQTFSKARLGGSAEPLGRSVAANVVDRGVVLAPDEFDAAWGAYHVHESVWVVRFTYRSRGREQHATWEFDRATGRLTARDRLASDLGYVDAARRRVEGNENGVPDSPSAGREAASEPGAAAAVTRPGRRPPARRPAAPANATAAATTSAPGPAKANTTSPRKPPGSSARPSRRPLRGATTRPAARTRGAAAPAGRRPPARTPAKAAPKATAPKATAAKATTAKAPAKTPAKATGKATAKATAKAAAQAPAKAAAAKPAGKAASKTPAKATARSTRKAPPTAGGRGSKRSAPTAVPAQPATQPRIGTDGTRLASVTRAGGSAAPSAALPSVRATPAARASAPTEPLRPGRSAAPAPVRPARPVPSATAPPVRPAAPARPPAPSAPPAASAPPVRRPQPDNGRVEAPEAQEPPSRFNQLAERLAAARRSQQRPSVRPDDDRHDGSSDDDDDERPLGDPRLDPRANVPRRYAPPAPSPAEGEDAREEQGMQAADPDGTTEADGAFVIRPRISAKQASELAYSDTRPARGGNLPLLSPAQS